MEEQIIDDHTEDKVKGVLEDLATENQTSDFWARVSELAEIKINETPITQGQLEFDFSTS